MTIWQPDLAQSAGPRYLAIVNALTADLEAGRLRDGDRLPTHRDLAYRLGVTVGTVTRAYQEAARRGLVGGEVGRGTFVQQRKLKPAAMLMIEADNGGDAPIDLSLNCSTLAEAEAALRASLVETAGRNDIAGLLAYQPHRGMAAHRDAAAAWLRRAGLATTAEQVVITAGGQHAMMVVFSTLTEPGDLVLTEALTYPGMKALASLLHLRLQGVEMDADGLIPEAFAAACKAHKPKALYCMPNVQNPLGTLMPAERRRAIAAIARAHALPVVEDDIYGFLLERPPPPLISFAPELGYFLTSLSKSLAPGLRIGFLTAPEKALPLLAGAMRATTFMAAPLMADIAAAWINDGTADRLVAAHRAESQARQQMARESLAGLDYRAHPAAFHGLLGVPESWSPAELAAAARRRGVLISAADAFTVGRPVPAVVRLCLGAAPDRAGLARALRIVAELARDEPEAQMSVV